MNEFEQALTTELAKELVGSTIKPSLETLGKTASLPFQALYALCLPLRKWIVEREFRFDEFVKLLELKAEGISPDKLVAPEPYVAVPAIQAISYCMDSEELRDMFANLLVSSMNIDEKNKVHPAYVEIIKQLTPNEAKILKQLRRDQMMVFRYTIYNTPIGANYQDKFKPNRKLLEIVDCKELSDLLIIANNLRRLELLDVEVRDALMLSPYQKSLFNSRIGEECDTVDIARLSDFGKAFCNICMK